MYIKKLHHKTYKQKSNLPRKKVERRRKEINMKVYKLIMIIHNSNVIEYDKLQHP